MSGKVLDLGAGDGVLNQFFSENVELYSFDLSEELLTLNPNKKEYSPRQKELNPLIAKSCTTIKSCGSNPTGI